ncbi:FAD-binding monooxygenase [Radiomyces spectabilis]|uniref:FAD-binding monooxygenase n=1 Tax=Radiomyces spectabilis TaxID=64574 RepID=UPI00221E3BD1|nr:FAD-binding monooxygenase [Radiomyces spectabilis]KAI8367470.1 FAD-binding monooxygenase [Radiomyces spectabilis]
MSTSPMQAEVLVSGAGPVGLFFAYQMAEYGHSVIIIDKKSGPTAESRAFFVTSRTLELLDHHGLAQQLLKEANIMRGTQLFVEGSLAGRATPDDTIETLFPQITIVPQSKTETAFVNALANTNTDILWNTELISYQQNEEGVVATVLSKDRQEKKIEAKYIIGADGCHSVVRKRGKGWTYEGVVIENKFALADVTLSGSGVDMLANHVNGFFHPDGLTLVVPIPNPEDKALFRVIGSMGQPSTTTHTDSSVTHGIASQAQSNTLIELETIQKIIDERMKPLQITAADPIWMTYFRVNERKANGFRRTRAFVMGDAAHCHSPAGGQGMNLGLQDG